MNAKRIQFIDPNSECTECSGTGVYLNAVDYGDTTVYDEVLCDCVISQLENNVDEIVVNRQIWKCLDLLRE